MDDAAWAISALLTVGFLVAAAASSGGMALAWFLLAVGMAGVTVLRYRSRPGPPAD